MGTEIGYILLGGAALWLFLYSIIRTAVKDGMHDASLNHDSYKKRKL